MPRGRCAQVGVGAAVPAANFKKSGRHARPYILVAERVFEPFAKTAQQNSQRRAGGLLNRFD